MTNKIIEAWNAQADHMNQWDMLGEDEKLAWAYKQALEDAVLACDFVMAPINIGSIQLANAFHDGTHACIEAIRALKEQQHG